MDLIDIALARKLASKGGSGGGSYTLPAATSETLGGVRIGAGITVDATGKISVDTSLFLTSEALKDYVTKAELEGKNYLTSKDLENYISNEVLENILQGYLKAEDIDLDSFLTKDDLDKYLAAKDYITSADLEGYVPKEGDSTIKGIITIDGMIKCATSPSEDSDLINKTYLDEKVEVASMAVIDNVLDEIFK